MATSPTYQIDAPDPAPCRSARHQLNSKIKVGRKLIMISTITVWKLVALSLLSLCPKNRYTPIPLLLLMAAKTTVAPAAAVEAVEAAIDSAKSLRTLVPFLFVFSAIATSSMPAKNQRDRTIHSLSTTSQRQTSSYRKMLKRNVHRNRAVLKTDPLKRNAGITSMIFKCMQISMYVPM